MSRAELKKCLRLVGLVLVAFLASSDALGQPERGDREAQADRRALDGARRPLHVPREELRRSIMRIQDRQLCAAADQLANIAGEVRLDAATRTLAALALGELACHMGGRGTSAARREGLSDTGRAVLIRIALARVDRAAVRQSVVRALGRASEATSVDELTSLRDDEDEDPILRGLAAQALTRITGEDHFDESFRDGLVSAWVERSSTYEIRPARAP